MFGIPCPSHPVTELPDAHRVVADAFAVRELLAAGA